MRSRLRRVAVPCSPISGDVVADWPQAWRRNVAMGANFWRFRASSTSWSMLAGEFGIDLAPDHGRHDRLSGNQTRESILAFSVAARADPAVVLTTFPGRGIRRLRCIIRAISLVHGRKRIAALFLVPTMPFVPWLGSAVLPFGCVFFTTPTVKCAGARR